MRKCNHMTSRFTWREVKYGAVAVSRWCIECGVMLSMGPSNDEPAEVQVEIRAAEIALASVTDPDLHDFGPMDWIGWDTHSGQVDDEFIDRTAAGHLAREIATHDDRETRDADAWPWDQTRPLAEQWPNAPASEGVTPPAFRRVRDQNEPAPGWQERVFATIKAEKSGLDKPTGDPLDAETRKAWNADLDAVERGS